MANFTRKVSAERAAIAQDNYRRRSSAPTVNAMAAKWNVSRGAVWNAINGVVGCRALTPEQQAQARRNHAIRRETKTIAQLAREWGLHASTVANDVVATRRAERKVRRALALMSSSDRGEHGVSA